MLGTHEKAVAPPAAGSPAYGIGVTVTGGVSTRATPTRQPIRALDAGDVPFRRQPETDSRVCGVGLLRQGAKYCPVGQTGVGKTGLACGLLLKALEIASLWNHDRHQFGTLIGIARNTRMYDFRGRTWLGEQRNGMAFCIPQDAPVGTRADSENW